VPSLLSMKPAQALVVGAGCLAIMTCGTGAAQAYVQTLAVVSAGESSVSILYGYNYATVGSSTNDACTGRGDCSATASGTVDATGGLTSASDTANLSVTLGPNRFSETQPVSGSAFARGSLASGTLGVLGTGDYSDLFDDGGQSGAYGRGLASIGDGLHFHVSGADSSTVTDIGVTFAVHGAVTLGSQVGPYEAFSSALQFGGASFQSSADASLTAGDPPTFSDNAANWVSTSYSVNSIDDIIFHGVYALTGPTTDLGILATLDASCGDGFNCDYSHTGAIAFSLPDGVTFTSDSGDFLTAASAVPEPGSLLLLSTGLGLSALRRRWSKRTNRPIALA
jgi:hypothetical protein